MADPERTAGEETLISYLADDAYGRLRLPHIPFSTSPNTWLDGTEDTFAGYIAKICGYLTIAAEDTTWDQTEMNKLVSILDANNANIALKAVPWGGTTKNGVKKVALHQDVTGDGASPVVVDARGHGFTTGDQVTISGISDSGGALSTGLNGNDYTITVVNANQYTLNGTSTADSTVTAAGRSTHTSEIIEPSDWNNTASTDEWERMLSTWQSIRDMIDVANHTNGASCTVDWIVFNSEFWDHNNGASEDADLTKRWTIAYQLFKGLWPNAKIVWYSWNSSEIANNSNGYVDPEGKQSTRYYWEATTLGTQQDGYMAPRLYNLDDLGEEQRNFRRNAVRAQASGERMVPFVSLGHSSPHLYQNKGVSSVNAEKSIEPAHCWLAGYMLDHNIGNDFVPGQPERFLQQDQIDAVVFWPSPFLEEAFASNFIEYCKGAHDVRQPYGTLADPNA